ncbi:hypothetical protein GC194_10650 [bacterium]|nr:hypothetical protein [bacterium]
MKDVMFSENNRMKLLVHCFILVSLVILMIACGNHQKTGDIIQTELVDDTTQNAGFKPADADTMDFLWRGDVYDEKIGDTVNKIILNTDFIKRITDAQRAAIGYVATFIGNECWWDGEANDDRNNLDCKIISALGLGYQCSPSHLGFLRQWFANDTDVLDKLEKNNCPTTPYTATIQETFESIQLVQRSDTIIVNFVAGGVNLRELKTWEWWQTDCFLQTGSHLNLVKTKSKKLESDN